MFFIAECNRGAPPGLFIRNGPWSDRAGGGASMRRIEVPDSDSKDRHDIEHQKKRQPRKLAIFGFAPLADLKIQFAHGLLTLATCRSHLRRGFGS